MVEVVFTTVDVADEVVMMAADDDEEEEEEEDDVGNVIKVEMAVFGY